jgi:hypothetical protein
MSLWVFKFFIVNRPQCANRQRLFPEAAGSHPLTSSPLKTTLKYSTDTVAALTLQFGCHPLDPCFISDPYASILKRSPHRLLPTSVPWLAEIYGDLPVNEVRSGDARNTRCPPVAVGWRLRQGRRNLEPQRSRSVVKGPLLGRQIFQAAR